MKKPLQPKSQHPIVEVCLALKELGYHPIPLPNGKFPPYKGYPTAPNTPDDIVKWTGRTAAVLMSNCPELLCIDIDIKRDDLVETLLTRMEQRWPDFMARCPRRRSGGATLALFGRMPVTDDLGYASSNRWGRSEAEPKGHQVEVFTCKAPSNRYVAVWGVHSEGREYTFDDVRLWEIAIPDLPPFAQQDLYELFDMVDAIMREAGLEMDAEAVVRKGGTQTQHDLDPDAMFKTHDETLIRVADIAHDREAKSESGLRGYGNLFDDHATRNDRCIARVNAAGEVQIWDTHTDTIHLIDKPVPAEVVSFLKALSEQAPPEQPMFRPAREIEFKDRVAWLLDNYAYYARLDKIVTLDAEGENCMIPFSALNKLYAQWFEPEIGPRGGVSKITAAQCWLVDPNRLSIEDIQLRPDRPFPVFTENDKHYKNIYRRPTHDGVGDIAPWRAFMVHLLPEPVEREWFLNWLAHKWLHPEVPGVGVVMVAADASGPIYGTGRGLLSDIMERLIGSRYVRRADFDLLTGKSGQSVYTGWYATSLLICVSEAKDDPDSGRWSHQRATYERLKEIIEPRATMKYFHHKYGMPGDAMQYTSFFIASNNDDAVQIPENDRRIAVLRNGVQMTPETARGLTAWMNNPGNIAALASELEARDLTAFDVYTPLHTETKTRMQTMARSEFDEWKLAVRAKLGRGALFTTNDLKSLMLIEAGQRPQHMDQFNWMITRWVRGATDLVAGREKKWRMLAHDGGEEIRCWTDYEGPAVSSAEDARARVLSRRRQQPVNVGTTSPLGTEPPRKPAK